MDRATESGSVGCRFDSCLAHRFEISFEKSLLLVGIILLCLKLLKGASKNLLFEDACEFSRRKTDKKRRNTAVF